MNFKEINGKLHIYIGGDDLLIHLTEKGNIRLCYQSTENDIQIIPETSNSFEIVPILNNNTKRTNLITFIIKDNSLEYRYKNKEINDEWIEKQYGKAYSEKILNRLKASQIVDNILNTKERDKNERL